jgi:hypothetical protein
MKGWSKQHNKGKRRRENKVIACVLGDPKKREQLITEVLLRGSPIQDIVRLPLEVKE